MKSAVLMNGGIIHKNQTDIRMILFDILNNIKCRFFRNFEFDLGKSF